MKNKLMSMQLEKRALYNLLRMNWLQDPGMDVEEWQTADYRELPLKEIFNLLEEKEIYIDKSTFHTYAEQFSSPEELHEALIDDLSLDTKGEDQVYLLLFELWRRFLPEKPCLSIFCDELDHQIFLYDQSEVDDPEAIEDVLANLKVILDENADMGVKPSEVFELVAAGCANDIEGFLYDFITDQLDNDNYTYAQELFEGLDQYVKDSKWFDLLRCRLLTELDPDEAEELIKKVIRRALKEPDLQYYLDILSMLIQGGVESDFRKVAKKAVDLVKSEEDFQDLLSLCADHYECLDKDEKDDAVQKLLEQRSKNQLDLSIKTDDPHLTKLKKILA